MAAPLRTDFAQAGRHLVGSPQRNNLQRLHDWLLEEGMPSDEHVVAITNYQQGRFGRLPNHVLLVTRQRIAYTHDGGMRSLPLSELDTSRIGIKAGIINGELTLVCRDGELLQFRKGVSLAIQEVADAIQHMAGPSLTASSASSAGRAPAPRAEAEIETQAHTESAPDEADQEAADPVPSRFRIGFGHGPDVLTFPGPAGGVFEIVSSGQDHTAVWSLDEGLQQSELLVNQVGHYSGRRLVGLPNPAMGLQIDTGNSWEIWHHSMESLPLLGDGVLQGRGDDVILTVPWGEPGGPAFILEIVCRTDGHIALTAWGDNGGLLVNQIGSIAGRLVVPAGTAFLVLNAEDPWALNRAG
jgi:hypothetical protein